MFSQASPVLPPYLGQLTGFFNKGVDFSEAWRDSLFDNSSMLPSSLLSSHGLTQKSLHV